MSYTLRQVQPLLTKPELELFQASRAGPIKEFTLKRLASKVTRSRALRDKYRDMYKRQTVQTQRGKPQARQALGGENTRTQTKSEILDEVLKRFEAQHKKLLAKEAKETAVASKRAATRTVAAQASATSSAKASATKPTKPATKKAASKTAAKTAAKTVGKTADKSAKKRPSKPAKKRAAPAPVVPTLENLVNAVREAVAKKHDAESEPAYVSELANGTPVSEKLASAPTDITPVAKRLNPLKADTHQKIIHASARSQTHAAQAKRDSR